ncbi:MAG: helix-hairpin-helix domain-containing protein [Ginsengibacter sp.]
MWNQFLEDYFNFTKKERRGFIYAVSIILIAILLPFFLRYFIKEETIDHTLFEKEIAQLRIESSVRKPYNKKYDAEYYNDYTPNKLSNVKKAEVFFFDPNTATVNDWIRLGIKQRTVETIQKYISKGGKFYKPDDLKKIWGLSKTDAERLLPYVNIKSPDKGFQQFEKRQYAENVHSYTPRIIQKVDVNLADTTAYIALPGIGSKLSQRIISFRDKLGGFYSIDQVGETFLLPDSTFQKIKPRLIISNNYPVKKININIASVNEMKVHPYIRYNIANAIFQFRQQHGNFESVEQIKRILIVTEEMYLKLLPYLTIE